MNKIFFTADTHFGSERTLELSKRPFKNTKEMDNTIIDNWNKTVSEEDTVYHLGDFGNFNILPLLNGKIYLVMGNYERIINTRILVKGITIDKLEAFDGYAYNNLHLYLPLNSGMEKINICHEPSLHDNTCFNLFGHIHKLCMIKSFGLNVGIDCHNFYPCNLEIIKFYKNGIEKHYNEEVFL